MSTSPPSNKLLAMLSAQDLALLMPHLQSVKVALRHSIEVSNKAIEHVYFPVSGIVSVVAKSKQGEQIEAGLIGREGMTGLSVVLGNHRSPHEVYVQMAGAAQRISADKLREAIMTSATLHSLLLRFTQTFMIQVTQTALANGYAKIEERLARWLLMARDRLDTDDLKLTHEFMALMLGVRRAGVTISLHELESKGLVRSSRGAIRIVDREGLEIVAGGAYGVAEAEYKRLIG
jgi:CRP-like cAMP-binding protein